MYFKRYAGVERLGADGKLSQFAGTMAVVNFLLQPNFYPDFLYIPLTPDQLSQCRTEDGQTLCSDQD